MEKQDIMDYVLKTPENTNPAILKSMLDQLEESSSGGGGGADGLLEATINNDASSNDAISIIPFLVKSETASEDLPGYTTANNIPVEIAPGNSANIMISPEGFCFPYAPNTPITVTDGNAQIINTKIEGNEVLFVVIKGNCTLKYVGQ